MENLNVFYKKYKKAIEDYRNGVEALEHTAAPTSFLPSRAKVFSQNKENRQEPDKEILKPKNILEPIEKNNKNNTEKPSPHKPKF
jgi:hypothetical protein